MSTDLFGLFAAAYGNLHAMGWNEFSTEQASHNETMHVFVEDSDIWEWGQATFENWQSEFCSWLLWA